MSSILIKNGTVVDPKTKTEKKADVWLKGSVIERIAPEIAPAEDSVRMIDASGCYILPGLIDMHVHLRDPGLEYKETIETGAAAALAGGFTAVAAMPNTKPVADCAEVITYVRDKAKKTTPLHIHPVGAITKGQQGKELAEIEDMVAAGAPAISEDGKSVMNSALYEASMEIAAKHGIPVLAHCEDIHLVKGGVMNEGLRSKQLGLPGISNAVEDIIAARDIILAEKTGVHLHLCHCSTKNAPWMIRAARARGISISAEVCPHHFALCSEEIPGDDPNFKMNPPIRNREDMEALRRGLREDVFDVIATDHAPHSAQEKSGSMVGASHGVVGLETAAAVTYTSLVRSGMLSVLQMAEKMSYNPARILGISGGILQENEPADLMLFDPADYYTVDPEAFLSKGRATPFAGMEVYGRVKMTIVGGEIAYTYAG